MVNKKVGRKKLNKYQVFDSIKYLSILFFIYECRKHDIKCKKKQLTDVLVNGKYENGAIMEIDEFICVFLNSHFFNLKCKEYELGNISKKELKKFSKINPVQFLKNNSFRNSNLLSKYLTKLSNDVKMIKPNYKTKGYPYWDFTPNGLKEFENFRTTILFDNILNSNYKYRDLIKDFIEKLSLKIIYDEMKDDILLEKLIK